MNAQALSTKLVSLHACVTVSGCVGFTMGLLFVSSCVCLQAAPGKRPNVSRRLRKQLKRTHAYRYEPHVCWDSCDYEDWDFDSSDGEGSW